MRAASSLTRVQRALLREYQHEVPVTARPFAAMAAWIGASEFEVIDALRRLQSCGVVQRVGPVFRPGHVGASTLAAMAVPRDSLARIANLVTEFDEVNHNYEREHAFNLWFVVTAEDRERVAAVLDEIRAATGLLVLDLPLEQSYHIDLGFAL